MPEEPEDVVDVPEAAAVPANWPTNGASPAEALQAQVARDLANDPLAEVCFRAETARARGNACFGEGDVEGAVAEWTASIALSGAHARCAESKALALANRSLARLSEWADVLIGPAWVWWGGVSHRPPRALATSATACLIGVLHHLGIRRSLRHLARGRGGPHQGARGSRGRRAVIAAHVAGLYHVVSFQVLRRHHYVRPTHWPSPL